MTHPGISDEFLYDIPLLVDGSYHNKIKQYFSELKKCNINRNAENFRLKRQTILLKLMKHIVTRSIVTFEDYLWHCNITCRILLLEDTTIDSTCLDKLSLHTFQTISPGPNCPIKVHLVAKNLYKLLDDEFNLIFIAKHIANYNSFTFDVSLSLVWSGLLRIVNKEFKMFRIHDINIFENIFSDYSPITAVQNLENLNRFLYLFSYIQNTTILVEPKGYSNNFSYIKDWLIMVKHLLENIFARKHESSVEYLYLKELLILDIIHLAELE